MSAIATYSAATAKARAMYAKRLTGDEWRHLESLSDVRSMAEALHQSAAWSAVEPTDDADALCAALDAQVHDIYRRLCLYLRKERDRQYMAFFLKRKELTLSYSNEDYQAAWDCIAESYRGLSAVALRKLLGAEADMLNLVYILRLRRFPASLGEAKQHLIPVRLELKKKQIDALLAAKDDAAVRAVLKGTPWEKALAELSSAALDEQYRNYMESFCKKLVAGASPSAAVPVAFMMLTALDKQALVRLIRAAELGLAVPKGG